MSDEVKDTPPAQGDTEAGETFLTKPPAPTPPAGAPAKPPEGAAPPAGGEGASGEADPEGGEGETKPEAQGAPEAYEDFALPEGQEVAPQTLDAFKATAKELGLPQAQAQKLVDMAVAEAKRNAEAQAAAINARREGWTKELQADPEYGGDKLPETQMRAARAWKALDPDGALREVLESGLGDYPPFIRMLARADEAMGERGTVMGSPAKKQKSADEVLFED